MVGKICQLTAVYLPLGAEDPRQAKMARFTVVPFALCVLCLCLAEENKDSGKADAHRLNWGGAVAGAGHPGYPGAYASVADYEPRGYYPPYAPAYPPVPAAYPPVPYSGSYYPPSPWSFKTDEGKKLPE